MELLKKAKEQWGAIGEWFSIAAPVLGLFLFVHHENITLGHRLDATNQRLDSTNQRIDTHFVEINKRADLLHQEFIDLIKERRKEG